MATAQEPWDVDELGTDRKLSVNFAVSPMHPGKVCGNACSASGYTDVETERVESTLEKAIEQTGGEHASHATPFDRTGV